MSKSKAIGYRKTAELFATPRIEQTFETVEESECYPIGSIDGDNPIEFRIAANNVHAIDPKSVKLNLRVKLTQADGTAVLDNTELSVVNNLMHSLFSTVEVYLNDAKINSNNTGYYPYSSYMKQILYPCFNSRETVLYSIDEKPGVMKKSDNPAFKDRASSFADGNSVELIGKLNHSLFTSDKLIPSNASLSIKLRRSTPDFFLLGSGSVETKDYKFTIQDASISYDKILLDSDVLNQHTKFFNQNQTVKLLVQKDEIKTFAIAPSSLSTISTTLYANKIPEFIVIGLVNTKNLNGSITTNPFDFQHNKLTALNLLVDAENFSYKRLNLDFDNNKYIKAYEKLVSEIRPTTKEITKEMFKDGHCLFFFRLCPTRIPGFLHKNKSAQIRLEAKFSEGLSEAVNVILYSESQGMIEVDKFGNVQETL